MQSYTDRNSSSPPWIQMLKLLCWHFCSWGELSITPEHTWHWFVYGSAHFLSDATLSSSGPASGSTYRLSASGRVYNDGSWNKTTRCEPHRGSWNRKCGRWSDLVNRLRLSTYLETRCINTVPVVEQRWSVRWTRSENPFLSQQLTHRVDHQ